MPLETNRHLDDEQIEKYSRGFVVAEAETSRFEEHLLICEFCQARVAESDQYIGAMRSAAVRIEQEELEKKSRKPIFLGRLIPIFVAVAVLLVIAVAFRSGSFGRGVVRPPFAVTLTAIRGEGVFPQAPSGGPLSVEMDLAGLSAEAAYRLELVDQFGKGAWQGSAPNGQARVVARLPALSAGTYFLRVYSPSGKLLREFGLEVASR